MSDPALEAPAVETDEQTEPDEPTDPDEPEADQDDPDEPGTPDDEPTDTTDPEPEFGPGDTDPGPIPEPSEGEKEIEALYQKLGQKAKNYIKGLSELVEGSSIPVTPCELCADCYPGIRWLQAQSEETSQLIAAAAIVSGSVPLLDDPNATRCGDCDGWGAVKLPSYVPGNDKATCKTCHGAGYLTVNKQSGVVEAPPEPAQNGAPEPYPGTPMDDPAVADLVARGFTIVPPMPQIAPAEA